MNIAETTLSSKLLTHHKEHFAKLAVDAVLRLKGSGNLEAIHVIKKLGGSLIDSYLDEGIISLTNHFSGLLMRTKGFCGNLVTAYCSKIV